MGKILLMDCTLRDGGYINDWKFGENAIRDIAHKLARTGLEYFEVGFLKDIEYSRDCSIFSSNEQIADIIAPKNPNVQYCGMVDINEPIPLGKFGKRQENSIDILRIIFKKGKAQEGYEFCKQAQALGYKIFVQVVGTNEYSDKEFIDLIEKYNTIKPDAFSIVDTLGVIKKKDFLRMVELADHNLLPHTILGYHSHNNLQQAFGNAESMTEMNLKRDILIDGCVFGMGRGAGNLNLELFAGFLNENFDKSYVIEPMLEVIDDYLNDIYSNEFWGYSLPFYLTAVNFCHPNYAKYLAGKGTLTLRGFNEILKAIPEEYKQIYNTQIAEALYLDYQQNLINDKNDVELLQKTLCGRALLLLGPGKSLQDNLSCIHEYIDNHNAIVISLNFVPDQIKSDYVFSCHMRRYSKIQENKKVKKIITSNVREAKVYDFMLNFSSYACDKLEITDNAGIVFLNFLHKIGVKKVAIAGLDGYAIDNTSNYVNSGLEYRFDPEMVERRNHLMRIELNRISKNMNICFITPSKYWSN